MDNIGTRMIEINTSPLHEEHVQAGARLMPLSGWVRPLHYGSADAETLAVRTAIGIFDLHPMSRHKIEGPDAFAFMQYLVTSDVSLSLRNSIAQYTCFCDEQGGIIDDVLIFAKSKVEFLVTSSVVASKTLSAWLLRWVEICDLNVQVRDVSKVETQFALQGPRSLELIEKVLGAEVAGLKHMQFTETSLLDVPAFVARIGYTGEPGYEIFTDVDRAPQLWRNFIALGADLGIAPFGVMAAQVLRLEKGYVMYGVDINVESSPYEAGLGWTVCLNKNNFIGKASLSSIKAAGVKRKLCRYYVEGVETMPKGTKIYSNQRVVGEVTSCCYSSTLHRVIGMGWVDVSVTNETECHVRRGDSQWLLSFVDKPFYDPEGARLRLMLSELT